MSLDINWIIIAIIFTALVIEVLTVVAYVFENHWSFDKPRTRTSRSDVFQGLVPDAYTGVWTAHAISAVTQSSDTVIGAVDPVALPPSQKPRPLPRPAPDDGPFAGFIARFSSWASTFAKRTTVMTKPKHSAGNLETSTPAPTGTRPATGTCITTDSGVITQCPKLKRSLKSSTYLSGVAALQGIKVQAPVDALTRISLVGLAYRSQVLYLLDSCPLPAPPREREVWSHPYIGKSISLSSRSRFIPSSPKRSAPITRNVVATEIISPLAKTKVLKVHEVKKTRISVYQLPPPSVSLSPRAFDQAKPPAATERYVQPLSKAPIKLNVPARLPCYSAPNLAAASYKRHSAKASATSASVIIIPPEPEDWDKKISSKVEVTKTRLELKEPELVSGSAAPPIVDLEPQVSAPIFCISSN
ncbi:unnamed protein product [Rhizoctonia solani]|uniref:Uncharacterized protein n=1 Tax=Rhizoctonia solani TaxID=456999 RepID=A0A8H3HXW9_9AGAM|nr:unnamed protein product [Rhizoctonia solani]